MTKLFLLQKLRELPPEMQKEVQGFVEFLLEHRSSSRLPQHPNDHPIIEVIRKLDSSIRDGLIGRDESIGKFNELCSDSDEHVRYYAAWYVVDHFRNTELHDKAAQLLLEPLVKILNETDPPTGKHSVDEDESRRFYVRHDVISEMERIGSLLAIPYLMELLSDTAEYDAWGMDVFISIAEFAQGAIDEIKTANNTS